MTQAKRLAITMSILAVAVRLIWINQPYIDNWSWRQSDVAAIARNYFQGGFHFGHPQINWAGDQPGYVGTEFPVLPFFAAICYKIFGVHEWVGRIQAVILFAVSLPFFFLLVRKISGEIAAVWALFFYSFAPLGMMAGRCFMPDMPSLALSIIGFYFFQRWIDESELSAASLRRGWRTGSTRLRHSYGGQASFLVAAIAISLSILIKLPSAIIGAPLACLAFQRFQLSVFRRLDLWFFAAIALLPAALWYGHAYQVALQFYPHHFFGAGGVKIMSMAWYLKIAAQIATSTLTPFLLILAGAGVLITSLRSAPAWQARSTSSARPFRWWLAAMILFIVIVGYGNRHQWYQLPLIPIAAAFAGAACAFIGTKITSRAVIITFSILLAVSFSSSAFLYARSFYQSSAAPLREAGLKLKAITPSNTLVVAADNGDPTVLYYAERKGWHFLEKNGIYDGEPRDSAQAIVDLEELRKRGASYLVVTSNTSWWLDYYEQLGEYVRRTATLMDETSDFKIYKLNPVPK
jgi:4-amino-4-deoxy-L-arabinose transferase-like glycosyltransferase